MLGKYYWLKISVMVLNSLARQDCTGYVGDTMGGGLRTSMEFQFRQLRMWRHHLPLRGWVFVEKLIISYTCKPTVLSTVRNTHITYTYTYSARKARN